MSIACQPNADIELRLQLKVSRGGQGQADGVSEVGVQGRGAILGYISILAEWDRLASKVTGAPGRQSSIFGVSHDH